MGGTFDPVHVGHLAVAEEARESLGLERILFVVAGIPPHKDPDDVTPVDDRLAMVELAIAGNDAFELSRLEVERPAPSYSADTIIQLDRLDRQAGRTPALTAIRSAEPVPDRP